MITFISLFNTLRQIADAVEGKAALAVHTAFHEFGEIVNLTANVEVLPTPEAGSIDLNSLKSDAMSFLLQALESLLFQANLSEKAFFAVGSDVVQLDLQLRLQHA